MRCLVAVLCLLAVPFSAHAAPGARGLTGDAIDVTAGRQVPARDPEAVTALRAGLGTDAIVSVDARNGGLRLVGRLDGFLTPPSTAAAADIALGYVRANRAAFGLAMGDIDNLVLVRRVTTVGGLQRLFWQQRAAGGAPALDSGLRANVTADGRLVNVAGSPVPGVGAVQTPARLNAGQARMSALDSLGAVAVPSVARPRGDVRSTTTFANGDRAALGVSSATRRAAWDTIVKIDGSHTYRVIVDATTGETLLRRNIVQSANATVFRNFPGAALGGVATTVSLDPWLAPGASTLNGPNVHAFADVNDDDFAAVSEETPISGGNFTYAMTPFGACTFTCTWDPFVSNSFSTNRNQNATQAFYFVNTFHDWLKAAPFGFTAANGNFEVSDPVQANTDDGANGPGGFPNAQHVNNANMSTPPDGTSPTMQMYLFQAPFLASNGGDDAGIVYHEYTHGLSNRLVVDSLGNSTLNSPQAGAMGEAWSDWYAMDYLADPLACGCEADTAPAAELLIGKYVSNGATLIRSQAIDCAVGVAAPLCATPGFGVPAGGYTYGSFGKINGSPEVHADGEIWAQTLWQLRTAVGAPLARNLITRAMELSPDNPSFLDMRNAILQADLAVNASAGHAAIWSVFANRGMGYFAGSLDSGDVEPVESFALPPAANAPRGTVSGTVIDIDTHAPVIGTRVSFAGLDPGFPGGAGATTLATGVYTLPALPTGSYPYLVAGGAGYEPAVIKPFNLAAGAQTSNLAPRRGWALASGGGRVVAFTGGDNSQFGCGPSRLIDGKLASGWGSDLAGGPPTITVQLPASVTVKSFGIDPSATCGDPSSASMQQFQVATSPDGVTFTVAAAGTFTLADGRKLNEVTPTAGAADVRFVRLTAITNFGNAKNFVDVSEFSVHGVQPGIANSVITGPPTIQLGATAVFSSATSVGPGGSPIVARKWSVAGIPPSAAVTYGLTGAKLNQKLTMTLEVTDFVGRTGSSSRTVTVVDTLGPVVTLRKVSGKVGRTVTLRARLTDPSGLARTAVVRFGDGKSATVKITNGKFSVKHKFKKARTFAITVIAKDRLKRVSRTTSKVVIRKR